MFGYFRAGAVGLLIFLSIGCASTLKEADLSLVPAEQFTIVDVRDRPSALTPLIGTVIPASLEPQARSKRIVELLSKRRRPTADDPYLMFIRLVDLVELKAWTEVIELADAMKASSPLEEVIGDYIAYFRARALLELGKYSLARGALDDIRSNSETSVLRPELCVLSAESFFRASEFEEAAKEFGRCPGPSKTPDSRLSEAVSLLRSGHASNGEALLRTIAVTFPDSGAGDRALEELRALNPKPPDPLSLEEAWKRADRLRENRKFALARTELRSLDSRFKLDPSQKLEVDYALAMTAFDSREYAQALSELTTLKSKVPADRVATILYDMGRAHARLHNRTKAEEHYREVLRLSPPRATEETIHYNLAVLAHLNGQRKEAIERYQSYLKKFPTGKFRESAVWFIALQYLSLSDWENTLKATEEVLRVTPPEYLSYAAALYWRAVALEKLNRPESAVQAYYAIVRALPFDYYFDPSVDRIQNLLLDSRINPLFAPVPEPRRIPSDHAIHSLDLLRLEGHTAEAQIHLRKAFAFMRMGLGAFAAAELQAVSVRIGRSGTNLIQIARLFSLNDQYDRAFRIVNDQFSEYMQERTAYGFTGFLLRLSYPLAHEELVSAYSASLPPALVYAIMREESHFNPRAVSRANAYGLMQLLPETGNFVARALGSKRQLNPDDLLKPAINIRYGAGYLRHLYQKFNRNLPLVIAAYNAGPDVVKSWTEQYPELDTERLIEALPFRETRHYVKRVLRSYRVYGWLYGFNGNSGLPSIASNSAEGKT